MDIAKEKVGPRILQLDGWRGVSISLVVIGHLFNWHYSANSGNNHPIVATVLPVVGVNIFFVISGFIITKLALREFDHSGRFSTRNFYTRRFFRIIPPFFLYIGSIILAGTFSLIQQRNSESLIAAAFVCNLPFFKCGWFVGHSWTLAYEEQFYIVFPLLFAVANHRIRIFIGALFVALVALPFLSFFLQLGNNWHAVARFVPSFSYICAGAVVAAYEERMQEVVKGRWSVYVSCVAASVLMGLLFLNAIAFVPGSKLAYLQVSLSYIFQPICLAWLVGSSVHQSNLFTRALTTPPLLFLGMISYSLYLWQELFTGPRNLYSSDSLLLIPPLMFVVAALSYYFVERPCVQLGKRFLRQLPNAAHRTPPARAVL